MPRKSTEKEKDQKEREGEWERGKIENTCIFQVIRYNQVCDLEVGPPYIILKKW